VTTIDEVTIDRSHGGVVIEDHDPTVPPISVIFEFPVDHMTDEEVLEAFNDRLRAVAARRLADPYFAEEVPPGREQIEYDAECDQWIPRGSVLRCLISDGGPDYETSIWIDDHELSLTEFGRLLLVHNGWGMRITFVPNDELDFEPEIRRWRRRRASGDSG
jgi:hypothetical protein